MPLIERNESALLVIDIQTGLMPSINQNELMVQNARKLVLAAQILNVSTLATEQYPKGLGQTLVGLLPETVSPIVKTSFGACREPVFLEAITPFEQVIVIGCEAHVCVLQTVLGMLAMGKNVYVVADAIGSRTASNQSYALRRMEQAGANIVTGEMVMFEWLEDAKTPEFKQVQALLK